MKNVILILVVLVVFFACAAGGYLLMAEISPIPETVVTPEPGVSEQHNIMLVQVDRLNNTHPVLTSVWFVSLYFAQDAPPALAFIQLYPDLNNSQNNIAIQQSLSLDAEKNPSPAFWNHFSKKVNWEGFIIADGEATQKFLEWIDGPGDYLSILKNAIDQPEGVRQLIEKTCPQLRGTANREMPAFNWGELTPHHFHISIPMEIAMDYWNRLANAPQSGRCDVLLAK